MINDNLVELFAKSFKLNWEKSAVVDYISKREFTYGEYAAEIEKLHILFRNTGIMPGDVVAVCGKNSIAWSLIYMSAITYGAVIVPILDEFNPKDITHIINHSETVLFFCDKDIWRKMQFRDFDKLLGVVSLQHNEVLESKDNVDLKKLISSCLNEFDTKYSKGYTSNHINFNVREKDAMAEICYTSGTTSLTKGVMLSYNNLCGNVKFVRDTFGSKGVVLESTLCILPLAHSYGVAFNLLAQLEWGAKITFLGKIPTPNILLEACKEVRPTLLFLVPLIFEKIFKNKIEPIINKPIVAKLLETKFVGDMICRYIGRKVYNLLGGNLEEAIIGGAAINGDVENFFSRAKFPIVIGYGMTECAPLISYIEHEQFVPSSVGRELKGLMEVRIDNGLESNEEIGEIQVKGENVMLGYFKEPEITRETFTEDGWLKTGDLGMIDSDGNIFIKGRSKTMLLGSSGENIYPEPIEWKLANMPFVGDCMIVQHNQKLEAWVYPDQDAIEKMGISSDKVAGLMEDNRKTLNPTLARFEAISRIRISSEPFPKTPKRTIKRMDTLNMINGFYAQMK